MDDTEPFGDLAIMIQKITDGNNIGNALVAKIAWILNTIEDKDEKLARIQELIGWWAMWQAGGLNKKTLSTYLEEP